MKKKTWLVIGEMSNQPSSAMHPETVVSIRSKKQPTFADAFRKLKKKGWDIRSLYSIESCGKN